MPLDPNIILAGRPAPIENPMQMYSQMLSARGMQQQQAQQAALAPYQQQQAQQVAQENRIKLQQMQQDQRDQQLFGEALQQHAQGTAGGSAAPAAAAPQQSQPGPDGSEAPDNVDSTVSGYGPTNPVGPATPKTQTSSTAPINLLDVLQTAAQNGMSYRGQAAMRQQILADQEQRAKARQAMSAADLEGQKDTDARHDEVARRLQAFMDNTPEYQQANWNNFNQQLLTDKLYTPEEAAAVLQQHPDLPDPQTLKNYILHFRSNAGQNQAAEQLNRQVAAEALETQRQNAAKLAATKLPEAQAQADQAARANWGGQLAAQINQDGFNDVINRMPLALARQVNLLTNGEFDPDTTPGIVQKWGQTAQQQVTTAETASRDANTAAYRQGRLAGGGQRPGSGNTQAVRTAVANQAARAIADSSQGGGSGYDDAIRNVQQFYQNDPDMQPIRGLVVGELMRQKAVALKNTIDQTKLDTQQKKEDWAAAGGETTKYNQLQAARRQPAAETAAASAYKVGDVVTVKGNKLRITAIHPNGTFDGDPL